MTRILILLAALACAPAPAAPPLPSADYLAQTPPNSTGTWFLKAAEPIDKQYPLPQDPAVAARRRAGRLAWHRRHTLEIFEAHGDTKAPWADKARAAIDAYCVGWSRRNSLGTGLYYEDFLSKLRAAVDAGCDDPLVNYWDAKFLTYSVRDAEVPPGKERGPYLLRRARELKASRYPAAVKMHAYWNAHTDLYPDPKAAQPAREFPFLAMLAEASREADLDSREYAYDFAGHVLDHFGVVARTRRGAHELVRRALADAPAWTRSAVEGLYLVQAAWDARGIEYAHKTSDEQFEEFGELILKTKKSLEAAWKADPASAIPAAKMVIVAMALSAPRAEMEAWFVRAMTADPDCAGACDAKLRYLQPKWCGSAAEAEAFCRQCFRTGNYYAGLPYIARYPDELFVLATKPADKPWRQWYLSQPKVWPVVRAVYVTHLAVYPNDAQARLSYALEAVEARQYVIAAGQFAVLGDDPPAWVAYDLAAYRAKKAEIEAKIDPSVRPKR